MLQEGSGFLGNFAASEPLGVCLSYYVKAGFDIRLLYRSRGPSAGMEPPLCVQSSPRTARKSEWLRSALAHHHCPDPGVENEIVVLATGIDQYLQEVFHHLAYPNRDDTVSAADFTALCAVLGLTGDRRNKEREKREEDEEFEDVCSGLPSRLCFKEFHSRLCGYFRVRTARKDSGQCAWRLPVTEDTELVEKHIRLRWPRVRRRKCVSFDLSRDQNGPGTRSVKGRAAEERETEALRELVEDLRSALQGSDARCLALEVAVRRERARNLLPPSSLSSKASSPASSITFIQGKLVPTHRIKGAAGEAARRVARRRDIRDPLLRELKLIRSSRDGQLEEAMKFNERLEEEVLWAYRQVRKLQGIESALRKENAQIRRRAEEAREALSLGLQRVRMIQEQAQAVPQLQSRINQLESELLQYRSCRSCVPDPTHEPVYPVEAGDAGGKTDAECLQRAVEGRAASDEEEEDRGLRGEGAGGVLEVKKLRPPLHSCSKGCQSHGVKHPPAQKPPHEKDLTGTRKDGGGRWKGPKPELEADRGGAKDKRPEEEEADRRTQDKERIRVSLLEEKLSDALTLLLQLRNNNVSRRALGKIVMDTLDACSRSGDSPSQVLKVADALCVRLASTDLLSDRADDGAGERRETLLNPPSGRQSGASNPLLISC